MLLLWFFYWLCYNYHMDKPSLEFEKNLTVKETGIPGLQIVDLPVHGDSRGWFKENWQHEKMSSLGLPDLGPVQNNISFNAQKGVTRGIHAEPWDKFISIGSGKIFGAWVDLREGPTFGKSFTAKLDPSKAIFVPRGVGNSFQALEDNTVYVYLVNDHWSAEAQSLYTFLNLADPTVNIKWPIPLDKAELSDKDKKHPFLEDVVPMKPRNILVTGADSKVGRALQPLLPDAEFTTKDDLDITSPDIDQLRSWRQYDTIINLSSYANVDESEQPAGRIQAWDSNVKSAANLARLATTYKITLIQLSADYVFDGTERSYDEDSPLSPINVYGQTMAAAEAAVATSPMHYIIRTGWIVGDGRNFVDTMCSYAKDGLKPHVVNDQVGRLTFADDIADFIYKIIGRSQNSNPIGYGIYNYTGDGIPASWADVARRVYELTGASADSIVNITTDEYQKENSSVATRPLSNILELDRVRLLGFQPKDWEKELKSYLKKEK